MLLCFSLMAAIQEISARIGRVTDQGIAGNIRAHYPPWLLRAIVVFTFALFAAGIIGIGLLAVPVLAGAYALGWTIGFDRKPLDARAFYGTIAVSTVISIAIDFVGLEPIKALFWSAVINGVVAVPLMVLIMLMAMRRDVLGSFVLPRALWAMGWLCTGTMTVAVAIMFATL